MKNKTIKKKKVRFNDKINVHFFESDDSVLEKQSQEEKLKDIKERKIVMCCRKLANWQPDDFIGGNVSTKGTVNIIRKRNSELNCNFHVLPSGSLFPADWLLGRYELWNQPII